MKFVWYLANTPNSTKLLNLSKYLNSAQYLTVKILTVSSTFLERKDDYCVFEFGAVTVLPISPPSVDKEKLGERYQLMKAGNAIQFKGTFWNMATFWHFPLQWNTMFEGNKIFRSLQNFPSYEGGQGRMWPGGAIRGLGMDWVVMDLWESLIWIHYYP